jgi:uncharacterized protein (DUF1330 family)
VRAAAAATAALLVGILIGSAGVATLKADRRPAAYAVAEIEVTDPHGFMQFAPEGERAVLEAGGKFLARGEPVGLSGDPPTRLVLVQFESMEALRLWWDRPDWQEARKNGERYAKFQIVGIEGSPP